MQRRYPQVVLAVILVVLGGCALAGQPALEHAISEYHKKVERVSLGDSKEKVLSILSPTQANLSPKFKKSHESYLENESLVEIYFFRSGWQRDGLTTDDEFTPYIFRDGILTAFGWTTLGGPKSVGQVRTAPARVTVQQQAPPKQSVTCITTGNITRCN